MGNLNVWCLLFSTAPESRNHSVLLRDHLHACKTNKMYTMTCLRWTVIWSNSPLKIFLIVSFLLKYSGFLKCEKKHGISVLRVVEWVALIRFLFGMWHY